MILGLDLSSSITGLCVLDSDGNIVVKGHVDLRKEDTFFDKIGLAKNKLIDIIEENNIEQIWIQQSLQAFRPGLSSAKTLLTLAKFNGIISWILYEHTGIMPDYIGASSARKKCDIKIPRGEKAKKVVLKFLLDNEPSFVVEYTKFGNVKQHFFDIADAIVIARAGFLCHQEKS